MKKIIRLTERDLARLVKRVIKEEEMEMSNTDLPACRTKMESENDMPGSSMRLEGPIDKMTANFLVSPNYRRYIIHKNGKGFCYIPAK